MNQEELKQRLVELISKAKHSMLKEKGLSCDLARNYYFADHLIANGVTIRERGEWMAYPSDAYMKCSVCGREYLKSRMPQIVGYCPNPHCGADMRGVKDDA